MHGIRKYITNCTFKIMINAYVHSVANYCLDLWAVQSENDLLQIQNKIDRFLVMCLWPSLLKKHAKKNQLYLNIKANINMDVIRKDFNMYTIIERRNIYLLKLMYDKMKTDCSIQSAMFNTNGSMTRLSQIRHSSVTFERSWKCRGIKIWNELPREWEIGEISRNVFVRKVKEWIVEKRKDDFYYY